MVGPSTAFGKDMLPRLGGLLDSQPISDVIDIQDGKFQRAIYAGNVLATVSSADKIKILSIRATNFEAAQLQDSPNNYEVETIGEAEAEKGRVAENKVTESEMVDLTAAKIVVSGGRGMKNGENFSMLYELADKLGKGNCSVGASRAAVDAGFVPNDLQVG